MAIKSSPWQFYSESLQISTKEYYQEFEITKNNKVSYSQKMPKSSYRDYEHFAMVFGKFNPYTFFYKEPKIVQKLYFVILREVFIKAKL